MYPKTPHVHPDVKASQPFPTPCQAAQAFILPLLHQTPATLPAVEDEMRAALAGLSSIDEDEAMVLLRSEGSGGGTGGQRHNHGISAPKQRLPKDMRQVQHVLMPPWSTACQQNMHTYTHTHAQAVPACRGSGTRVWQPRDGARHGQRAAVPARLAQAGGAHRQRAVLRAVPEAWVSGAAGGGSSWQGLGPKADPCSLCTSWQH